MTSGPRLSAKKRIAPRRPADAAPAAVESTEIIPIRTRDLTKNYGELVAVDRLNLEVRAGEIFGLLGQNGAGKTTTILMLLGLTEPTSGQARVVGLDPARRPLEVKRRVGYMPDAVGFYTDMTGRENLRYTARLNRIRADDAEMTIEAVLDQVGLTSRADDTVETYSRGMLQRLGIADALVKDPDILILDEPTTAIDPLGVVEILDLLRRLVRERGMAILLSSHLLNQVQSVCDRIGIFASGRLIGQGTLSQLAERVGESRAHVEVAFDGLDESSAPRVGGVLGAIDGVKTAKAGRRPTDPWTLAIDPDADEADVRRRVPLVVADQGLQLVSLRAVEPSLEDIYRHAVAKTQPAHGAVA
jgi:ABC-2 type transport system ATP-binding protein